MSAHGYNGWKNWETWQINLWLDNEEPLYREKVRFLKHATRHRIKIDAPYARTFCELQFPDGTPDMRRDEKETVAQQWEKVDWEAIADHFRSEAEEYA